MNKNCLMFMMLLALPGCTVLNKTEQTCTVTDKESVRQKDSNQYRVYTSCGTFVVEDSIAIFRFDSADVYGSLKVNTDYKIKHGGYRVGFLSMFPNIISYKEVK